MTQPNTTPRPVITSPRLVSVFSLEFPARGGRTGELVVAQVGESFQREHFGRHHYRPAVNCLVNYSAGVIKPDLYITGSGDCVCLVNLIKQQVQNQVIWL